MNGQPSECFYNKGFVTHFTNHFPDMKVIRVDERLPQNGSSIHA
jgi:putative Holliday junction resolvase